MKTSEIVASKIKQLQLERSRTRILRAKSNLPDFNFSPGDDLQNYLKIEPPPRPIFNETILPVFYPPPPPKSQIIRDKATLLALSFLYPIGKKPPTDKMPDEWYIVSESFHIDRKFEYKSEWDSIKNRIFSIIYHSVHLLNYLSQYYLRPLPYPLIVEGQALKISKSGINYDLCNFDKTSRLKIAVALLCADAAYLSGGPEKDLLPNLASLLLLNPKESISTPDLSMSIYDSSETK